MHKTISHFTPIGPRLLVEKIDMGEQRIGRLVIADAPGGTKVWKPIAVRVIHPGTGRILTTGQRVAPATQEGDIVILASWRDYSLSVGGEERYIVPEEDILGEATLVEVAEPAASST